MELNMFKSKNHTYFDLIWTCFESSILLVIFKKSAFKTCVSRRKRPNDLSEGLDDNLLFWMNLELCR